MSVAVGLGDIVRQLRHARGLSQEELSAISGVSRPTITNIERGIMGRGGLTVGTVMRLSAALGVSSCTLVHACEQSIADQVA